MPIILKRSNHWFARQSIFFHWAPNLAAQRSYLGFVVVLAVILYCSAITESNAHGGGLDSSGCHRDLSAGEYHCHRDDFAGMVFESKEAGLVYFAEIQDAESRRDTGSLPYDRDLYSGWIDKDGDCQDTRQEVLIGQAIEVELDATGCRVTGGVWIGPYTGEPFTDPSDLHIDHVVSLKQAHESGAAFWPSRQRRRFANDMDNLLAVDASENMRKGSRGPEGWLPDAGLCGFIARWVMVKKKWNLKIHLREQGTVDRLTKSCSL